MSPDVSLEFPPGFLWGCATAAHQVEGHSYNDWWRWAQTPGRTFQNQEAGAACDWWGGRFAEDFDRAAAIHNNAQRISIDWSRIEPEDGKFDRWALDQYRAMLLALRERGMKPMVTLHHFTNPLWLADRDGWLWDETPARFAAYVRHVVEALGDLCDLWCTINEPMVYATQSYIFGSWPPGKRSRSLGAKVAHNLLCGHVMAYHAIKELHPNAQVGFAKHIIGGRSFAPHLINRFALRLADQFFNRAFLEAFVTGRLKFAGSGSFNVPQAKGALDWIGMQYYQEFLHGFRLNSPGTLFLVQEKPTDIPVGPHTWGGLNPAGNFSQIRRLYELLRKPIYITESGVPDIDDSIRPGYMAETLVSVWKALGYNFPVKGFFWWSLVDNFEWAEAYDPRYRFGLYHMDFETQTRTPTRSAGLYGAICGSNALDSRMVAEYAPGILEKVFPGQPGAALKGEPTRPPAKGR